jgi:MoxR-like ATPase
MTSNAEREFPPAFLRRCLQLEMRAPDDEELVEIVKAHLYAADSADAPAYPAVAKQVAALVRQFIERRDKKNEELAADQLLNVVYLLLKRIEQDQPYASREALIAALTRSLGG